MTTRKVITYVIIGVWTVGIYLAFAKVAPRSLEISRSNTYINVSPPLSSLSPKLVKIITLGHKDVYDAFMFMWMIQVVSNPELSEYTNRLEEVATHIVSQEPEYEALYLLLCLTLSNTLKRHEPCRIINDVSLKLFPNSWRLAMIQGYIEAFELKDKARAALFYSLAASRPESPPYVASLAKRLINDEAVSEEEIADVWRMSMQYTGWEKFREIISMKEKGKKKNDK